MNDFTKCKTTAEYLSTTSQSQQRVVNAVTMDILKDETCPFLRLPLEIRNEIYRYLLCTQYTRRRSKRSHAADLFWPSYTYHSHTDILRTNRQIQIEALYLARHENLFVHICCRPPNWITEVCAMVNISPVDLKLGHRVMQIDLNWVRNSRSGSFAIGSIGSNGPSEDYLICLDQLSAFCEALFMYDGSFDEPSRGRLSFNLNIYGYLRDEESIRKTLPVSTQRQLLEPFTLLQHARDCQIHGPIDSEYKASVLLQISHQRLTLEGFLQKISSLKAEGKHAFLNARFSSAINAYGSALKETLLRWCTLRPDSLIHEGEFAGQTWATLRKYLYWKLCSDIAAAYLKLHRWQNALDWTSYGKVHFGFGNYNPRDYAVFLFRFALACNELGECERASKGYRVAGDFVHTHCKGVQEDRELDALMLPLTGWHDEYLEVALQETTV